MNSNIEAIKRSYQEAMTIAEISPWQFFKRDTVFAIEHPESKELYFVTVNGQDDELPGIIISKGYEAYLNGQAWLKEGDDKIKANALALYSLYYNDEPLEAKEEERLKLAEIQEPTAFGWPHFKDFTPEYLPWLPSDEDFKVLEVLLRQIRLMLGKAQDKKGYFDLDYGYMVRKLVKGIWQEEFAQEVPEEHSKLSYMRPNNPEVISQLPLNNGAVFEAVLELSDLPFQYEEGARPIYPWIFIMVNGADGSLLDYRLTSREESFISVSQSLVETLNNAGYRPSVINTDNAFTRMLLSELCRDLNVVAQEEKLEYADKLIRLVKMRLNSGV